MTKTESLLVKKAQIESVLQAIEGRTSGSVKQAGIFDEMRAAWEKLTAMEIREGVAIIPLHGVILPDDPFAAYYGDTSLIAFQMNLEKALSSRAVKGILITAFSPGGYVYGVESAANALYAARGKKPIVGYTESLAASACYWLLSAADKVVLGAETAEVGSIGVYQVHFDYSAMLENAGIKVTEITSGEFKGLGSPYTELSEEDKKLLQKDSNYVYSRFVNAVARNRGMSTQDVLKSANGLTFFGSDAVERGLADSINSFQEAFAMATDPKTNEQTQATAEQEEAKRKAEQEAAAKLAKENEEMKAQLAAYAAKDAASAKANLEVECKSIVKEALGREATAEEIEMFAGMPEAARKGYAAQMKEAAAKTKALAEAKGLTQEKATDGKGDERTADNNLLVHTAKALGLAG